MIYPKKKRKFRGIEVSKKNKKLFLQHLKKIGYCLKNKYTKSTVRAFQRRFRSKIIDGKIDKECLEISKNLIKRGLN